MKGVRVTHTQDIDVKRFGSVTVVVSSTARGAAVLSHRPEELHEHEDDWNRAIRWVVDQGFEAPSDDPDFSSPESGETYVLRPAGRLALVASA